MKRAPKLGLVGTPAQASPASDHPAHWDRPRARTIVLAGAPGAGKSQLAVNLAVALGARGARVLLADLDLAEGRLDVLLGAHPRWDLQHVLAGEKTLEEIVVDAAPSVRLVPASPGAADFAALDDWRREMLWRALGQLEGAADLAIVDTTSGPSPALDAFCSAADDVIVVTRPDTLAASDAYALLKRLHAHGLRRAPHVMVNFAAGEEEGRETARRLQQVARRFLRVEPGAFEPVPFDPAVARAANRQEPVVTAHPTSPAAIAFRAAADRLWQPVSPEPDAEDRPDLREEKRVRLQA